MRRPVPEAVWMTGAGWAADALMGSEPLDHAADLVADEPELALACPAVEDHRDLAALDGRQLTLHRIADIPEGTGVRDAGRGLARSDVDRFDRPGGERSRELDAPLPDDALDGGLGTLDRSRHRDREAAVALAEQHGATIVKAIAELPVR